MSLTPKIASPLGDFFFLKKKKKKKTCILCKKMHLGACPDTLKSLLRPKIFFFFFEKKYKSAARRVRAKRTKMAIFRTFFEACESSVSRKRCFLGFHKNVKKIAQRRAGRFVASQKKVFFLHFLSTFAHLYHWGFSIFSFFFQSLQTSNLRVIE